MSRAHLAAVLVLLAAAAALAGITPGPTVTDATVVERVRALRTRSEQMALAEYYAAAADAEVARIEFYERLFRAYNELEGRDYEPLRRQARQVLKAAREMREHLDLLASGHRTRALEEP